MTDIEIQAIKKNVAEKAYKKGYSQGIEMGRADERKKFIEKACELYEEALCRAKRTGIHGIPQMVNMFKQTMEE